MPPANDTKVIPKENIIVTAMDVDDDEDTSNRVNAVTQQQPRPCLMGFSSTTVAAAVIATDESTRPSWLTLMMALCEDEESSSSDEDTRTRWGGSVKGKSANIKRDFDQAYNTLKSHYFNGPESLYTTAHFRRRFRVSPAIFNKVYDRLHGKGVFRPAGTKDAVGKNGIDPLVRMTAVFRILAYGSAADSQDEYLQVSETVAANALKSFCQLMVLEFGEEYLNRTPTQQEKRRILEVNARRGFPGLFASWDCKHFIWDKCPVRLQGQHRGHHAGGKHTKILEAIADDTCFFWFINFGDPGSLNDLNVLAKSSIVGSLISGLLDIKCDPYLLHGRRRDWMYFLADGIYPEWAMFVKTIPHAVRQSPQQKFFAQRQEAVRKDIERAFGILVKKFHVLARPIRLWDETNIRNMLYTCVILHNMACEERLQELGQNSVHGTELMELTDADHMRYCEDFDYADPDPDSDATIFAKMPVLDPTLQNEVEVAMANRFARATALHHGLTSKEQHLQLKRDLLAHLSRR